MLILHIVYYTGTNPFALFIELYKVNAQMSGALRQGYLKCDSWTGASLRSETLGMESELLYELGMPKHAAAEMAVSFPLSHFLNLPLSFPPPLLTFIF